MYIALIDKDLFASLFRYGKIKLPDYSFSAISNELSIEEALRLVLRAGNPIEYPSQYIIVEYDSSDNPNMLQISSVSQLIATDADGMRLFSSHFRKDLIIQPEKYSYIFQEYLDDFRKTKIRKGIVSFRKLCGLDVSDNYDDEVDIIYRGITNRVKYRHHYQLPSEERGEPYALMISYDRHAPYPRGWTGYFYDVIESFCYHKDPNRGYSETVIEGTGIYKRISSLPVDATSKQIVEEIKNEPFTSLCNEFYNRSGGYLTPYLFFILRDRFRNSDSFAEQLKLISQMKEFFPEAFDTASIFIGGFFGYDKFYDDYYIALNLPIFRIQQPFCPTKLDEEVSNTDKKTTIEMNPEDTGTYKEYDKTAVNGNSVTDVVATKDVASDDAQKSSLTSEDESHDNVEDVKPACSGSVETSVEGFLDGTELYKNMYNTILDCLSKGKERCNILEGLTKYKDNNNMLEKIRGLIMSDHDESEQIKEYLDLKRFPGKSIIKLREYFQKIENK